MELATPDLSCFDFLVQTPSTASHVYFVWCFIVLNCVCQDCFGLTQAKLVLSCGLIWAPIKIFEGSPAYKLLDVHYASCYGWFIQQTMVCTLRYSAAHQTSTHNWLAQCMPGLSPPPHHFLHALVSALVQPPGCNSLPCRISGCPLLPSSSACCSKVCNIIHDTGRWL